MFDLNNFMGKKVFRSSLLEGQKVEAFFTTRDLPLKYGEREDLQEEVENNKKLLCEGLKIPVENLVIPIQTHSDNVRIVNREQETGNSLKGRLCFQPNKRIRFQFRDSEEVLSSDNCGEAPELILQDDGELQNYSTIQPFDHSTFENTDALITNQPNIALAFNFADCVPVLLFDPVKNVIAGVHAGWRGSAAQIAKKTVLRMQIEFNSNPEDVIALIGPCIGECCFEVQEDVKEKILLSVNEKYRNRVYSENKINLQRVNKFQLLDSGLIKIDVCEYCTSCNIDLFFSYRKENGNTARHSAVIMLKGNIK